MQTLIFDAKRFRRKEREKETNKVFELEISARNCNLELCSLLVSFVLFGFILPCKQQRIYNFFLSFAYA